MLFAVMMALLSCLPWSPTRGSATTGGIEVAASVQRGGKTVASVVTVESSSLFLLVPGAGTPATAPEQVLTTTVQDPNHPSEPWVVTTYRRPDESFDAFIKRHREMVEAVRKALTE
jgi:hypothetical protein